MVSVLPPLLRAPKRENNLPTGVLDPRHKDYYASYNTWAEQMASTAPCDPDLASPELPANCYETAATPGELFKKLDQWGFDNIVVPHGSSWGFYTPPNANWEHQLTKANTDLDKTRLIEVYSGHGNSEVFRDFAVRKLNSNGQWYCPEPQGNYLPACWQAELFVTAAWLQVRAQRPATTEPGRHAKTLSMWTPFIAL